MTKRILTLLALMLSLAAMAQNAVGDWRIHTSFVGSQVTAVAEGNQWVYYQSGSNLFRLDKETSENESLSIVNDLSDMVISKTYYNSDKDYLVVVYSNSNIDVILSDGQVVNMSEIKDAVMTSSKAINDVTFAPGLIYLAADFGYVVIDDSRFVVKESHLYGQPVNSVAQVGNLLFISIDDGVYYGDADEYHEQLSSFEKSPISQKCRFYPIDDKSFFYITGWTYKAVITRNDENEVTFGLKEVLKGNAVMVQNTPGGFLLNDTGHGLCYKTDETGDVISSDETGGELCSANPKGNGSLWAAGSNGLHLLGSDNYFLPNALSFDTPFWMTYNKAKDLLYVSAPTANGFFSNMMRYEVNTYDGMKWVDVTPEGAPKYGAYWLEFLPDDPNTYFVGSWTKGLYKVVNNEIALIYDAGNSPLVKYKGAMHPVTSIDRYGNVWVVEPFENEETPVMVLPASKTKLDQTTIEDWITPSIRNLDSNDSQRSSFLSTRYGNNDIKIYSDGNFKSPIVMWNSAGQLSQDPPQEIYNTFIDQDGLPYSWTNVICFAEDLNGLVWMGSTEGVISFNPAQAFSSGFYVNHIKVPRNDGTGMADYLLDGIQVNGIAVDGANRKWIATQTSGLFLVSPDGTEVIKKFNTTNSPLATNTVYKVCCNPNSNSVFVTTPAGVYEYFSDSTPAETTYDNIYAYPNPVRPDFTGEVTITGMMDNSLIKIADASGNVIRQLKSTGGMATWDCCDQYGERAKTGVYMVLCSQANGSGEAVVTKIAVIR
jgi:hypothetical protein